MHRGGDHRAIGMIGVVIRDARCCRWGQVLLAVALTAGAAGDREAVAQVAGPAADAAQRPARPLRIAAAVLIVGGIVLMRVATAI